MSNASVSIGGSEHASIGRGLLVFLGVAHGDTEEDVEWLSRKLVSMRIFPDDSGRMNLGVNESGGEVMVVSQFTLHASTRKGNRPSFVAAASPDIAKNLYEAFTEAITALLNEPCKSGVFAADMQVSLVNDGPVTILMDSRNKE